MLVRMPCYLINRSLRATLDGKVAKEVWISNDVDYLRLRVFAVQPMHILMESRNQNLMESLNSAFFVVY